MKIEHELQIYWFDKEQPTLSEVQYCFEEQDRWLPAFIFNNFGVRGSQAILRMYDRVRAYSVTPEPDRL